MDQHLEIRRSVHIQTYQLIMSHLPSINHCLNKLLCLVVQPIISLPVESSIHAIKEHLSTWFYGCLESL